MYKRTISYEDYSGVERTEDFYFNLTKAELIEMEVSVDGGYGEMIQRISKSTDGNKIIKTFKDLILKSYGEKSADGKRFIKSEELSTAFSQTIPYNVLFMELATDANKAAEFVNGLMPKDLNKDIPVSDKKSDNDKEDK